MTPEPRRFAPLKTQTGDAIPKAPRLRGVVFDVDGTLCEPQNYMFVEMRSMLGIPKSRDILEHVDSLPTPTARSEAMEGIRHIERTAMVSQRPQPGLVTLMDYLASRGVRKGICTRNFDAPVNHLLTKFLTGHDFDPIITREFKPPKPDPAGLLHIAKSWGLIKENGPGKVVVDDATGEVEGIVGDEKVETGLTGRERGETIVEEEGVGDGSHLIMVGDSLDDMTAGRHAGAATVLLVNGMNAHLAEHEHTDLVISRLDELIPILEDGFVGRNVG